MSEGCRTTRLIWPPSMLTRPGPCAAVEAATLGVRVNCVIPGLIETPLLMSFETDALPDEMPAALGKLSRKAGSGPQTKCRKWFASCCLMPPATSPPVNRRRWRRAQRPFIQLRPIYSKKAHSPKSRIVMALKYYHAKPVANSLKSMIPSEENERLVVWRKRMEARPGARPRWKCLTILRRIFEPLLGMHDNWNMMNVWMIPAAYQSVDLCITAISRPVRQSGDLQPRVI